MASKEQISALMDGDLEQQGILDQLESDADLSGCWQRYHLIGDAMRRELPRTLHLDIADSIASALEREPAMLAPPAIAVEPARMAPQTTATGSEASSPGRVVSLFKMVGQYAIAASVALAVVVGVQQASRQPQDNGELPVLPTLPLSGNASPVSLKATPAPVRQPQSEPQLIEQQRRVNAYLQDHGIQQRFNAQSEHGDVVNESVE